MPPAPRFRSKALATWIAVLGGSLGLHRFYLHGFRDPVGWLFPLPTSLGLYGLHRLRTIGQDDMLSWLLLPLLGLTITVAMFSAIVHGLTSDERWNARFNTGALQDRSGWAAVLGVVTALLVGGGVMMATIAFSAQHVFEYQLRDRS
jgi:hypothetical protein